jgi:glycosyltransferase involved in cell wall biosynthesis
MVDGPFAGHWLLVPEVVYNTRDHKMMRNARRRGMRVAAIFHDAIPVTHPSLVRIEAARHHAGYMAALAETDLLIAVSNTAAEQFRDFAHSRGLTTPPIRVCSHAGEVIGVERSRPVLPPPGNRAVTILCVSTLDPRKNHETLIRAFNLACAAMPGADLRLDLAGAPYKDAQNVVRQTQRASEANPRITWHGSVSLPKLSELYSQSDFTVYPSIIEGFGLPILESLWFGRPCICANFGAMTETATGGGCLTIDVRQPEELRDAIIALATQPDLRERLAEQIEQRPVKTWSEYADELCNVLAAADEFANGMV